MGLNRSQDFSFSFWFQIIFQIILASFVPGVRYRKNKKTCTGAPNLPTAFSRSTTSSTAVPQLLQACKHVVWVRCPRGSWRRPVRSRSQRLKNAASWPPTTRDSRPIQSKIGRNQVEHCCCCCCFVVLYRRRKGGGGRAGGERRENPGLPESCCGI